MAANAAHRRARLIAAALLLVLCVAPRDATAQIESLASVELETIPSANVRDLPTNAPGVSIALTTLRVDSLVPILIKHTKTVLLPGVAYGLTVPDAEGGSGAASVGRWHELTLKVGALQIFSKRWRALLMLLPTLASDFEDIDGDHFRFAGTALAMVQLKPTLMLGFGLVVNYSFGTLLPLPGLLVRWRISERLRLNVMVPAFARLLYRTDNRFEVGLQLRVSGNRYTVRRSAAEPSLPAAPATQVDNVRYTLVDGGGYLAVRLFSLIWLKACGGATLWRRLELFDEADRSVADFDLSRTAVFRLALQLRPPPRPPRRTKR